MTQIDGAGHPASARNTVAHTRQDDCDPATPELPGVATMGTIEDWMPEPGQRPGTDARVSMDDLELARPMQLKLDDLPRVYAQAQAYAEELRRLYLERQATEAELARKVIELERSHEQLLAYATDL